MKAEAVVAAFSDSPRLRETLAVLLEGDCRLQFLSPASTAPIGALAPDLAVLAIPTPTALLRDLAAHWPRLPIVTIDPTQIDTPSGTPLPAAPPNVYTVPLEPQAIRAAVLGRLPVRAADSQLRVFAGAIGTTLCADLGYALTLLRSLPKLALHTASPDIQAMLAAVIREQTAVLVEHIEHLERFRTRPREAQLSQDFVRGLCCHLEEPDTAATQRGLLCSCILDPTSPAVPGPVDLAALLASLLRFHLRRRGAPAVITVHATSRRVSMRYRLRTAAPAPTSATKSWPLLLADFLLESCAWRISATVADGFETLVLFGVV